MMETSKPLETLLEYGEEVETTISVVLGLLLIFFSLIFSRWVWVFFLGVNYVFCMAFFSHVYWYLDG